MELLRTSCLNLLYDLQQIHSLVGCSGRQRRDTGGGIVDAAKSESRWSDRSQNTRLPDTRALFYLLCAIVQPQAAANWQSNGWDCVNTVEHINMILPVYMVQVKHVPRRRAILHSRNASTLLYNTNISSNSDVGVSFPHTAPHQAPVCTASLSSSPNSPE